MFNEALLALWADRDSMFSEAINFMRAGKSCNSVVPMISYPERSPAGSRFPSQSPIFERTGIAG